jgi:hypothetical protein
VGYVRNHRVRLIIALTKVLVYSMMVIQSNLSTGQIPIILMDCQMSILTPYPARLLSLSGQEQMVDRELEQLNNPAELTMRPALLSCLIALFFEAVVCVSLSFHGVEAFASYLSASLAVAQITSQLSAGCFVKC